jgi:hypothetical protein
VLLLGACSFVTVVSDSGPINKQVATIFALGNRMAH